MLVVNLHHVHDGDFFHQIIGWNQQIKADGVLDGRLQNGAYHLFVHGIVGKIVIDQSQFLFSVNVVMVLVIDKNPADQVAHIVVAVVQHGICQEIVDVDNAAERAVAVLFDVWQFHHLVVTVELKGVAVEHKKQHIAAEL